MNAGDMFPGSYAWSTFVTGINQLLASNLMVQSFVMIVGAYLALKIVGGVIRSFRRAQEPRGSYGSTRASKIGAIRTETASQWYRDEQEKF